MKNQGKNQKEGKEIEQFEFCKVCRLNHSDGRRHIYFRNHSKALSALLSRFVHKISDVRFFLKYPSLLRPEHASLNRLWCIFCDDDISELGSRFACENAIKHLASSEHLKNVKDFLWRNGGGKDRFDSFRFLEADLKKWETRCASLKSEATSSGTGSIACLEGNSNNIHNEHSSLYNDSFKHTSEYYFESSVSSGVLPLQIHTNESYQVSYPDAIRTTSMGSYPSMVDGGGERSFYYSSSGREVAKMDYGDANSQGVAVQTLTPIRRLQVDRHAANVHTGAPPPWLEEKNEKETHINTNLRCETENFDLCLQQPRRGKKLNPKRVGAAWAERRKAELEMEKRGENVAKSADYNWLPNFGRVWQTGTRKESRKEFEMEKQKPGQSHLHQSEMPIKIEPYISKRMRKAAAEGDDALNGNLEGA